MCLFLITLGEPVSYPVNQVDGFELTIEKPTWSPFKGYTIRWAVTANSKEIYSFGEDGSPGFEYLERHIDGQWYRLTYSQDIFPFNNLEFLVLCQDLVQVKMRNFSHFNLPEAQPQCVFFYTIVRIHLVTYSYNGYEFVSYCRKLPDIRKSSGMPACNREF